MKNAAPSFTQIARFGFVVVIGLAAIASAKANVSYSVEHRVACAPDAVRLCASAIPNVSRIRDCMIEKKAALSAACRAVF